jgi:hypothetical protein
MSTQTFTGNVQIVWDDSVVLVFSFQGPSGQLNAGFMHQIFSVQLTQGSQTQISQTLQSVQQSSVQLALDPATWVETVKTGARGTSNPITVVYDDTLSVHYTNSQAQGFDLQLLYSIAGWSAVVSNCQYLWIGVFQATSVLVDSAGSGDCQRFRSSSTGDGGAHFARYIAFTIGGRHHITKM